MKNFDMAECAAYERYDTCLLIDDACENGSPEQFHTYVQQIFQCYLQEMITQDILEEHGIDFDEDLMDMIGNVHVSIPDKLCDFYKKNTYFAEAREELKENYYGTD